MTKFYHLCYDRRTIKELTAKEWYDIARQDQRRLERTRLIVGVGKDYVLIRKGPNSMSIPKHQLIATLARANQAEKGEKADVSTDR